MTTATLTTFRTAHQVPHVEYANSITHLENLLREYPDAMIMGGGSNVLITRDLDRPVIVIDFRGIRIVEETPFTTWVEVMAGTVWHDVVLWAIERDLGGIENLSLIPGLMGAAPIQNIGAYGVELKDSFLGVELIEKGSLKTRVLPEEECYFGYRDSIFKRKLKDKVVITKVSLMLTKPGYHHLRTDYGAITSELQKRGITRPTIRDISDVVISIRQSKLPDPTVHPNAGSFFKNPIVDQTMLTQLLEQYPDMPFYKIKNQQGGKVPAGWLLEQCGWKGKREGLVGTHEKQALVIVNYGTTDGAKIWEFAQQAQAVVQDKFGIALQAEVNVI